MYLCAHVSRMSYPDFMSNWHKVEICHLGPTESDTGRTGEKMGSDIT
jgi:hypothetical protein